MPINENDSAQPTPVLEEQQNLSVELGTERGVFGGHYYGRSAEFIAAPIEILFSLVRAIVSIPLTLATELPGFVLYLGVSLIALSLAVCVTGDRFGAKLFSFGSEEELVDAGPVDRETLRQWAELKNRSNSIHTMAPAGSAVEQAPAIITAVLSCDLPAVRTILAEDKDAVNARDIYGDTALAWAAKRGCRELIDPLLSAGAQAQSRAENGLRPVDWAARYGFKDIVTKLGGLR